MLLLLYNFKSCILYMRSHVLTLALTHVGQVGCRSTARAADAPGQNVPPAGRGYQVDRVLRFSSTMRVPTAMEEDGSHGLLWEAQELW